MNKSIFLASVALLFILPVFFLADYSIIQSHVNYGMIILLAVLHSTMLFLRIARIFLLLVFNGYNEINPWQFFQKSVLAGVVAIYGPLKSGELVAMEMYHDNFDVKRGDVLAVIVVSRIMDVAFVLAFAYCSLFVVTSFNPLTGAITLSVLVSALVVFLLSPKAGMAMVSLISKMLIWERIRRYIQSLAEEYYLSLRKLSGVWLLFIITLVRWGLEILFAFLLMDMFNISLSVVQIVSVVGFSYALGVSSGSPGAIGTSQLTAIGLMVIYGVPLNLAAASQAFGLAFSTLMNGGLALYGTP